MIDATITRTGSSARAPLLSKSCVPSGSGSHVSKPNYANIPQNDLRVPRFLKAGGHPFDLGCSMPDPCSNPVSLARTNNLYPPDSF